MILKIHKDSGTVELIPIKRAFVNQGMLYYLTTDGMSDGENLFTVGLVEFEAVSDPDS